MSRAEDLFDNILKNGEDAIDEFIETRKAEELFLDFKRSSDNGTGKRLSDIDRNNFAKAISGFGNSEGGVIVWGVDCSKDVDGADVAKAKVQIENPTRFAGRLNSVISGCTLPPHQTVRNEPIPCDNNEGFVISLIPKSYQTPHQVVNNKHYYIRAGDSFSPSPHDVLAGMFGRRPQPHIIHQYLMPPIQVSDEAIMLNIGIMLHNLGPGIASEVFITCTINAGIGRNCKIAFNNKDSEIFYGNFAFGIRLSLISKSETKFPPGCLMEPTSLIISIEPPFEKDLIIEGTIGCYNGRSSAFVIKNTKENLKSVYNEIMVKAKSGKFVEFGHEYTERIINSVYKEESY